MVGVTLAIENIRILDATFGVTDNGSTFPDPSSYIIPGIIAYKRWKIIGMGVILGSDGASTIAESGIFGYDQCDIGDGSPNNNAFATLTQDVNAGKQWINGDTLLYFPDNNGRIATAAPCENGGTHVWSEGALFNVWQTNKIAPLRLFKENVVSSTATFYGFMVAEVSRI